ncbi:MAG: VWA domain-containing protein [Bacteroidetes bacterium]|nr:VWA domain-containing protein [Bacteroidota bacterium]
MLRFSHPEYLWFLFLVPIGAIGFYFFNRWQQQKLNTFISKTIFPLLVPEFSKGKRYLKQALLLLTLACLILTVANPLVGTRLEEVKREGIDLFVTLDVSLSMKAEDIRPNRLEKAKRDVSELLKKLSGDRVGLIVFAGDAFVQFPLTSDYAAADLFLSAIDVDAVPVPGTQIGQAIELALSSFIKESPAQKAIIVVSDGENTEGDFMSAAEDAKRAGVRIYSVGMGTLEGGPIPLYDANGNRADYKRDRNGSIVLSKLDETALRRIAESTGGSYYRATSAGNEIEDIFKEINSLQKAEFGTKQVSGFESRYQYPLACAIFFLLIELMVSERRSKLLNRIKRLLPGVVSLLLIFVYTASGQTVRSHVKEGNRAYKEKRYIDAEVAYKKALEKDPKSSAALYDAGNAYYKEQRYDEALQHYAQAEQLMTSNDQRADAWYNIGNTLYQGNKYQEAVKAYQQSLRYRPGDQDALYNLQMALEKLKQQKNDQQNKQQQKQQNQQQQNKNQQNQQQNQQQKQQQQPPPPQLSQKQQMPKEEAERILEAIKNNEKEIQKNLRKREGARVRVEKDW